MRLTHEDIAMRIAGLLDLALKDIAQAEGQGRRLERIAARVRVARDGVERLAAELPRTVQASAVALGGNVVAFPGRRASA